MSDAKRKSPHEYDPHAMGDGLRFHVRGYYNGSWQVYGVDLDHICDCPTQGIADMVAEVLEQAAEIVSDADEPRTLDVRIATALFGWKAPLTPHPTRPLARYATDWDEIPKLVAKCVERDWVFGPQYDPAMAGQWRVCLTLANGDQWRCSGDTLQLALCRVIVTVLDATEETKIEEQS